MKIATGHDLSDNVLDTIFKLFDMDGDNCLSHKEFIGVMKDRVLRGLKVTLGAGPIWGRGLYGGWRGGRGQSVGLLVGSRRWQTQQRCL